MSLIDTLSPVQRAWVEQLLGADVAALLMAADGRQVEVRLYTNGGRVRKRPTVIIDGGPQELVRAD